MTDRKTLRRYVYAETESEILDWVGLMIKENRMQERPPNGKPNFPFYLEKYILHLKSKK